MEARFTGQSAATMNPAYFEGEALFFSIEVGCCPALHARDVLLWHHSTASASLSFELT